MNQVIHNFNQLFKKYHQWSFLFAKSFVHTDEIAEDIASESLIVMWERMQTETIQSPKSFLLKVIKNKALDYLKHQKIHRRVVESLDDWDGRELQLPISFLNKMDDEVVFLKEIEAITEKSLGGMPEKTRTVFVLSRQEQLSGKRIAEQMGITVKGVEYHITKALKVLTVSLKDYLNVS